MYERTVDVGTGRFEALVCVRRHPARDVVSRDLRWSTRYVDRLVLDRPVAERFLRSVRHAWDIATGSADVPGTDFIGGETIYIGRFEFTITSGLFASVVPLKMDFLTLRSREDLDALCAVVDEAIRIAEDIENAPDFQLARLPMPDRPPVSSWILWPENESAYAFAVTPSDLVDGTHRHATATHGHAFYPDPAGCEICWQEASDLIDYYAHIRRRRSQATRPSASVLQDRHIDPP